MRRYKWVLLLLALSACENPYSSFYQGMPDARQLPNYEPLSGDIQILTTNNADQDARFLIRRGFVNIGTSSFNAANNSASNDEIIAQAKKIGAHTVLVESKYTHTETGAMPLTLPNNTTSYSTGSATAYGAGGMVNAYGSSTTTTFGTQTIMMPYSVQRSDFTAYYFTKVYCQLGVQFNQTSPIDIKIRKKLGTNAGQEVVEVTDGCPAYKAGILPGDILLSINEEEFSSDVRLNLDKYAGKSATIKLYRDGNILKKNIKILPLPSKESTPI